LRDAADKLHIKLRGDWHRIKLDPELIELCRGLGHDLKRRAVKLGGNGLLDWLENTASHAIRIGIRQTVEIGDPGSTLREIYATYVAAPELRTHATPRKSASQAASQSSDNYAAAL
jgi:hypothetical protein